MGDPQTALQVVVTHEADTVTMALQGDLDLAGEAIVSKAVAELRPLTGPLVIDLGDVEFIDSTGLRSLIAIQRAALADTGTTPRLSRCTPSTLRLFELCGLVDAFDIAS